LNLLFDFAAFGIPLGITVTTAAVILIAMCWSISQQYSILSSSFPILLKSIFKASSYVFRAIASSKSSQLSQKLLGLSNVLGERKYLFDIFPIAMVSVGNNRDSDLDVEELASHTINNCDYLFLASLDP
jgi:hypothetical protein